MIGCISLSYEPIIFSLLIKVCYMNNCSKIMIYYVVSEFLHTGDDPYLAMQ